MKRTLKMKTWCALVIMIFLHLGLAAQDTVINAKPAKEYKNVVRYNLSAPILFGLEYIVFGYERLVGPHQSISVNVGQARLPNLLTISIDSVELRRDQKNSGYNFSLDYRFYLARENKHAAPHGLYIGPFYSFNRFLRDNAWDVKKGGVVTQATTNTKFNIHSVGFELGYQFVFAKRITLDLVMVGPGFARYDLKTVIDGNLDLSERKELQEAIKQVITQKYPGMNFVFANKEISADGTVNTWSVGFRYIMHVGFRF